MKTKRNTKKTNAPGKLLLQKQQVSRAQLGAVTGGGEISGLISGAISAIGSASSSLETPSGVVTGAASAALSAYNSNHWSDRLSFKW